MVVYPDAVFYTRVQPADVDEIVKSHLLEGKPVERLVFKD
jgi:NADP-reducing hydrogenase subunit HndC